MVAVFIATVSFGQISGIKTIPGDYATIATAIAAINTSGVGAGGVTFNVASGHTETLSSTTAGNITTLTSSAANPVVFQKSGGGANPKITAFAFTAATAYDGIIKFAGCDYVTGMQCKILRYPANQKRNAESHRASIIVLAKLTIHINLYIQLNRLAHFVRKSNARANRAESIYSL